MVCKRLHREGLGERLVMDPGVIVHVEDVVTPTPELPKLRDRSLDFVLARIVGPSFHKANDLNVQLLFDDHIVVVAGARSR